MINIQNICPSLYTAVWNSYHLPSKFLVGKKTLLSQEGTTQGDTLAMVIYGVGLLPLINFVSTSNRVQKWYVDDGNAVGKIDDLVETLKQPKTPGPFFGYVTKRHLITKSEYIPIAIEKFKDLDVEVVAGHRVLGSVIGSNDSCEKFLHEKSKEHNELLGKFAKHARISPQNVYKCPTQGFAINNCNKYWSQNF